jgi:hypothetical protein
MTFKDFINKNKMEDINITAGEIREILKDNVTSIIKKAVNKNLDNIETSISKFFTPERWDKKETEFENALNWAVELQLRDGLNQGLEEMKFKEMVATKVKEILSDETFLRNLAEKKIKQSLGLNNL